MSFNIFVCTGRYSWLIRLFHCGLTFGIVTVLVIQKSVLYETLRNKDRIGVGIVFLISHAVGLIIYLSLSYMDPGYINTSKRTLDESSSSEDELDLEAGDQSRIQPSPRKSKKLDSEARYRHCIKCHIKQPLRSKHCNECGRCVQRYDHHCPWIDNCVGEYNHSLFLAFMVFQLALIFWTGYWSWLSVTWPESQEWKPWLRHNLFFCLNMLVCIVAGLPLLGLTFFHCYLAVMNITTWESVARDRITYLRRLRSDVNPFHQGYWVNLRQFCCNFEPSPPWDIVYHKYGSANTSNNDSDYSAQDSPSKLLIDKSSSTRSLSDKILKEPI